MKAKEYLQEIKKIDLWINQKQAEYDTLKKKRTYIGGLSYSSDRIQTSHDGAGFTRMSEKLTDMQLLINREIDRWHDMRHSRIHQIQQLSKAGYVDILFRIYVQYQPLEEIAEQMNLSYYRVSHLHGEALKEFEKKYLKDSKE